MNKAVSAVPAATEPIRVLHVIDKLGVGGSSIHGVTQLLAQSMPMFDPRQFQFAVCSLRQPEIAGAVLKKAGIPLRFLSRGKFDPRTLKDLMGIVRRNRSQILHLHGFGSTNFGRLVSLLTGRPNIVHEHMVLANQPFYQTLADTVLSPLTTRALAISKPVHDYMVQTRKIQPLILETLYFGIPLLQFHTPSCAETKSARDALGIARDEKVVCTVGRLDPVKGLTFLLHAAARIVTKRPRVRFLIVGDGPDHSGLLFQARQLGIGDRVIFTGFRSDVSTLIGLSDVFVIPSLSEGGPITLFEAMRMRKPVVATPVGLISEVLQDGESGFIVPLKDPDQMAQKILMLLNDPELALKMGEKGWHSSQGFDMSHYVRRLEEIYRSLCRLA
jgi:glycosyltransferase involved in cell wall biosynthesis